MSPSACSCRLRSAKLPRIGEVPRLQALRLAEDVMLGHVRRIAAGQRMTAECLGKGADVMRPGAAADAEIAHAEIIGRLAELGDLVAIAGEGIQRHGEGMIVRDAIAMPV